MHCVSVGLWKREQANCINNLENNKHRLGLPDWISAVLKTYFCTTAIQPLQFYNSLNHKLAHIITLRSGYTRNWSRHKSVRLMYASFTTGASDFHFSTEKDIKLYVFTKKQILDPFLVHGFIWRGCTFIKFSLYCNILYCLSNFPVETLEFQEL